MQPYTRILKSVPNEIPCSSLTVPKFEITPGFWISAETHMRVREPKLFDPNVNTIDLKMQDIENLHKLGIYTPEQLDATHRSMRTTWIIQDVIQRIVAEGTRGFQSEDWEAQSLFTLKVHEEIMKYYLKRTWGVLSGIGHVMSGLIGLYFVFTLLRMTMGHVINIYNVYQLVGFTRRLFISFCPIVSRHVVLSELRRNNGRNNDQDVEFNEPIYAEI
jgi:hypothetical protein